MEQTTLIILLIGFIAGIVGGLAGIGGGLVIVPMLVFVVGMNQHAAQGTSLATLLLPLSFLAVINYHKAGFVNWKYVMFLSATFMIGSYIGGEISLKLNQKVLRIIFSVVMIISAVKILWDTLCA